MNRVEKIKETIVLEDSKELFEKNLEDVKNKIEENRNNCSHISIYMERDFSYPEYRCILCNKALNYDDSLNLEENKLVIYANDYLHDTPSNPSEQFDTLQTMFLGICKMYPLLDDKEVVEIFNKMIEESKSQKLDSSIKSLQKK